MIKINEYITVLEELNITQSDFMFLYCTYTKKVSMLTRYSRLFPSGDNTVIGERNIERLIDKGLIRYNTSNSIVTTAKFNDFFVSVDGAFEIFDLYPSNLKDINKQEFKIRYNEEIGFNAVEHKKIKQSVKYAMKHGIILPSIASFLTIQFWHRIQILKKNKK